MLACGVQGVLNVWHLVHYQRFYNSLVAQLVPTAEQASQSLVARVRILTPPDIPGFPPSACYRSGFADTTTKSVRHCTCSYLDAWLHVRKLISVL